MFPPLYAACEASSAVRALFGAHPRVMPHGAADQKTVKPYAVHQIVAGSPENYLAGLPDSDTFIEQVDVYADTVEGATAGARAIRDAVEPVAYIVAWRGQTKDFDTGLFRYSFDVAWITPRT